MPRMLAPSQTKLPNDVRVPHGLHHQGDQIGTRLKGPRISRGWPILVSSCGEPALHSHLLQRTSDMGQPG